MFPCPGLLYEGVDKGTLLISCSWKEHKWPERPVTALPVCLGNHLNIAGCFRQEREILTACSQSMDQHIILQIRWERSWAVMRSVMGFSSCCSETPRKGSQVLRGCYHHLWWLLVLVMDTCRWPHQSWGQCEARAEPLRAPSSQTPVRTFLCPPCPSKMGSAQPVQPTSFCKSPLEERNGDCWHEYHIWR